MELAMFIPN